MRITIPLLAGAIALACLAAPVAQAQIPSGLLQQLLPGSQGQSQQGAEQAVREAYERGYRQGRQDQERADIDRGNRSSPQNGAYQGQNYQGNQNYQSNQRNPYGR